MKKKDYDAPQDKVLYIGTSEQVAKLAPTKGLEPPIFLTDVYPGFFCKKNAKVDERWGIISIHLDDLYADMLTPSPEFIDKLVKSKDRNTERRMKKILDNLANYKTKWQKSLASCGVCCYLSRIQPNLIHKVMIYTAVGKSTNSVINNLIDEFPNPGAVTPSEHKAIYPKSLSVSRWLNGDDIRCDDIFNGETNIKIINEFEEKLANRFGLDVYYIKPEERGRKFACKKS